MEEEYGTEGMLDLYLYESEQLLEQLEEIVLSEKNRIAFDEESINEIFRIMHTIKGSSGIMMYDNIALAAHKLEDIFYYLRESYPDNVPQQKLTEIIFKVSDFIEDELHKIRKGQGIGAEPDEVAEAVENFLEKLKHQIQEKEGELPPENIYIAPGQYYIAPASDAADMPPFEIDLGMEDEPVPGDYVIRPREEKEQKLVGVSAEKLEYLSCLVNRLENSKGENDIEALVAQIKETVTQMKRVSLSGTFRKMQRIVSDASRRMDKEMILSTSGEELQIDRDIVESIADPLMHLVRNASDHGIERREDRILAGKKAEGSISLEAKRENDILYITVKDDGKGIDREKVFDRAKEKGMLFKDNDISNYTDEEIYSFLMNPGFSTLDQATEYSGRGVGMDVVRNNINKIGGKLSINSLLGKGTEISMEIPETKVLHGLESQQYK